MPSPKLETFQAVLFDLDGVLVDSYESWWHLLQDALAFQKKPPISREEFDASWGQGVEDDRKMFFPEWPLEYVMQYYEQNFSKYTGLVRELPGAKPLLSFLKKKGKRIGVASNSPSAIVSHLLSARDLLSLVDSSVGIDEVANGKPAPDLLLRVMDHLKIEPRDACYIGDSMFDEAAARAAGVHFIGYRRSGDETIQNLTELIWESRERRLHSAGN